MPREQISATAAAVFAGADATEGAEPLFLLQAQAMSLVGGVQQMEPDPDAPAGDPLLEVAASAAAALAGLLSARRALAVGSDPQQAVGQAAAAGQLLEEAASRLGEVFGLAAMSDRAGPGDRDEC